MHRQHTSSKSIRYGTQQLDKDRSAGQLPSRTKRDTHETSPTPTRELRGNPKDQRASESSEKQQQQKDTPLHPSTAG